MWTAAHCFACFFGETEVALFHLQGEAERKMPPALAIFGRPELFLPEVRDIYIILYSSCIHAMISLRFPGCLLAPGIGQGAGTTEGVAHTSAHPHRTLLSDLLSHAPQAAWH